MKHFQPGDQWSDFLNVFNSCHVSRFPEPNLVILLCNLDQTASSSVFCVVFVVTMIMTVSWSHIFLQKLAEKH